MIPTYYLQYINPVVEIAILWFVFYRILIFFEGTRAFQVLKGIAYLVIALVLAQVLHFQVLNWLLKNFFSIWIVVIVIIFQQELRAGLARLGQNHMFSLSLGESELSALIDEITDAVFKLSKRKIGALIAIERQMKLEMYIESGVLLDSKTSSALIQSIFMPQTPLHDGGIIIQRERIAASSCLFPLSENPTVSKTVGTRHRAALGLTEVTDAIVVLVSEETSDVSIVYEGRLVKIDDQEHLTNLLKEFLTPAAKVS